MKKILGSIKNRKGSQSQDRPTSVHQPVLPQGDSPEAVVVREVTAFCEAGAPGSRTAGDEYLHLPAIVDAAESSPAAAKDAAACIRRYFSKDNYQRGYAQYNAIMLTRILTDNPARAFTQNFDKPFVATVKELLREGRDSSVQQILRETLDYFEAEKLSANDTLMPLIEMWRKEKGKQNRIYVPGGGSRPLPPPSLQQQPRQKGLPAPDELAARIEEARTSARLLVQMLQSTPSGEVLGNDLIKEFGERARQANKSVQAYMACENPQPDENTMLTLIETGEQLNIAISKYQRAVLQARRAAGLSTPSPQPPQNSQDPFSTVQLQNSLPPSQPVSNYGQGFLPPSAGQRPISTIQSDDHSFSPPPGPPPGVTAVSRSTEYSPPPIPPPRARPEPQLSSVTPAAPAAPAANHQYDVGDNPFTDDAYVAAPKQTSYSLFNKSANQLRDHTTQANTNSYRDPYLAAPATERPGPYNPGYQSTPSYMHRQESATNHLTMHGASPPPEQSSK